MDRMTEVVERLHEANRAIESELTSATRASIRGMREQAWLALSRAGALVRETGPVLAGVNPRSGANLQAEVKRYAGNLIRLQRKCESVLAELEARRREVWQEEQSMRNLRVGENAFRAWE